MDDVDDLPVKRSLINGLEEERVCVDPDTWFRFNYGRYRRRLRDEV